jgi:hypothetical protein
MKRPWQVWLALALCGGALAAAMGWLSVHALRVDRERSAARAEAALEQRVSLALWRMDTKLAPLIAEEVARPHLFYNSFITLGGPSAKSAKGEEQTPSPLLLKPAQSNVLLNFDATVDGRWNSPQAPPAEFESLACAGPCLRMWLSSALKVRSGSRCVNYQPWQASGIQGRGEDRR